jgi:hypothetical protein
MKIEKRLLVKTDEIPIDNTVLVGNSSPLVDIIYNKQVIGNVTTLMVERNQLWINCKIEEEFVSVIEQYPIVPVVNYNDRIVAFYVEVEDE